MLKRNKFEDFNTEERAVMEEALFFYLDIYEKYYDGKRSVVKKQLEQRIKDIAVILHSELKC